MTLGTAALILILSVFNGFDDIIKDNLSDLDPDIKISRADLRLFDPDSKEFSFLYEEFDNILAVLEDNIFINYNQRQSVAKAKGVPIQFETNSALKNRIISGELSLHFGELPYAVLGAELAQSLAVNTRFSDKLELFYPTKNFWGMNLNSVRILPKGIFSVNSVVDKELIIIPLDQMRELLDQPSLVSSLEIRTPNSNKKLLNEISSQLGTEYKVQSREMQNESLFKMMGYEKLALYAILLFVIIIIAFNIYASLSMLVLEKNEDLFQMEAMGMKKSKVRLVFVLEGFLSSLIGALGGLMLGLGLAFAQIRFGLFKMPSGFLVSAYPCAVQSGDVLLTFAGVCLIGVIISLLFSLKMTTLAVNK